MAPGRRMTYAARARRLMQVPGISLDLIDRCQNHVLPGSKVRRHYMLHDYVDEKRAALGEKLHSVVSP
jgi:hypothetical protein